MSGKSISAWVSNRNFLAMLAAVCALCLWGYLPMGHAEEAHALDKVTKVEKQPLVSHIKQLREALEFLGQPLSAQTLAALQKAEAMEDAADTIEAIQAALDPLCLMGVHINPESRVKVTQGMAKPQLLEQGWSQFLVKVANDAGVTAKLRIESPQALQLAGSPKNKVEDRWMEARMFEGRPMRQGLSGLELEYRVVQIYSRDAGKRSAKIAFNVGQGTQDIGFRNDVNVLFDCQPGIPLTLHVKDEEGKPTMAGFVIRDAQNREYPSRAKRLAPDFAFHPQIYRADGEQVKLPPGTYTIECTRGPEYLRQTKQIKVEGQQAKAEFELKRWVDPAKLGWWSGDHHIHAAGCLHYEDPTQGVHAPDMMRHILGEDLKVGCNLTWGPCFDYQKQFFSGDIDKVSKYPYLLRYDIEVSGFGSHRSGHLCLLRLKDQMYPGGESKKHWPTLGLNTLRWAKKQGAVVGPAHSGWGLEVRGPKLPNYEVPRFDGIGANEYIMNVTHQVPGPDGKPIRAVDFISTVDTPYTWEINIWYHTLNVGYRTRISGETDFPCIYGDRVGLGRSYVKLDGKLDFDQWCEGIRSGRNYVSDGTSHLMEFTVGGLPVGVKDSELKLDAAGTVKATVKVAALMDEKPIPGIKQADWGQKPFWHIERARIDGTRKVPVELIVNGHAVARQEIEADGGTRDLSFDVKIERSSWVAIRVAASSHTNPVFVEVGGKPIRASRLSAEWCAKALEQCWKEKKKFFEGAEQEQAKKDFAHAREVYQNLIKESDVD